MDFKGMLKNILEFTTDHNGNPNWGPTIPEIAEKHGYNYHLRNSNVTVHKGKDDNFITHNNNGWAHQKGADYDVIHATGKTPEDLDKHLTDFHK